MKLFQGILIKFKLALHDVQNYHITSKHVLLLANCINLIHFVLAVNHTKTFTNAPQLVERFRANHSIPRWRRSFQPTTHQPGIACRTVIFNNNS